MKLLLASASPARRRTLNAAGITPQVEVSQVNENAILEALLIEDPQASPAAQVQLLAKSKAVDVLESLGARVVSGAEVPDVLVACDSMFSFDGEVVGKPHTVEVARERLRRMRGRSGELYTGHTVVDVASGRIVHDVSMAVIHMSEMTDDEIDAYIATGEPLEVAGSFTIDGVGGSFIDAIEGDYHGVVGISLPTVRALLAELGYSISQFWDEGAGRPRDKGPHILPVAGDGWITCGDHFHWGLNGAGGVLAWRENKPEPQVLLQLRAAWSHQAGTWSFPGGAIADGETALDGAIREFGEETGILANQLEVGESHLFDHGVWSYTSFVAKVASDARPQANEESQELAWINISQVDNLSLLPSLRSSWPALRKLVERAAGYTR